MAPALPREIKSTEEAVPQEVQDTDTEAAVAVITGVAAEDTSEVAVLPVKMPERWYFHPEYKYLAGIY